MSLLSIEIKARCADPARIRSILRSRRAIFKGLDRQIDTYFRVPSGRLKLREGNIENALIFYKRADQKKSKKCRSLLWKPRSPRGQAVNGCLSSRGSLKRIMKTTCGILVEVNKKREIYFIKNAKFHIDRVKRLGNFVDIEVFGSAQAAAKLGKQCEFYQKLLGIRSEDLVADSYSDQLLKLKRM